MRPSGRHRALRLAATLGLIGVMVAPAALPATAATEDDLVLRLGTDQEFSGLSPFAIYVVLDYEVLTLNYDALAGWDENLQSTEGFAESWTTSDDGLTTTFKIRPGMKWSDGEPATAEDAVYSYQLVLDAIESETTLVNGYIEGYLAVVGSSPEGPVQQLYSHPRHPYTQKLLGAFPNLHADRRTLEVIPGSPPDLRDPPIGCRFAARCAFAMDVCREVDPPEALFPDGIRVACHLHPPGSGGSIEVTSAAMATPAAAPTAGGSLGAASPPTRSAPGAAGVSLQPPSAGSA